MATIKEKEAPMNVGRIVRVIGPVIDVEFAPDAIPAIYNALRITSEGLETPTPVDIIVEVEQHLGEDTVRCVSMHPTDGLARGMKAVDTGGPIMVPVGPEVLGRVMNVVGEVEGLDAIIFDDMVDTGKTLILAARALLKHGARSVMAVATHGVFSGDAVQKIQKSPLDEMIVTDTLPLPRRKQVRKIRVLPVASLFADTILRTHRSESVSSLFM